MSQKTIVRSQEAPRDFRTEMPNIVSELVKMGLISHYARSLYMVYRRIAGEHGACWVGSRQLEQECGFSRKVLYGAKRELLQNFSVLQGKSLIENRKGDRKKEEADTVTIVDIWQENHDFFKNKLTWGCRTPGVVPWGTNPGAVGHQKKEPSKKEPKKNHHPDTPVPPDKPPPPIPARAPERPPPQPVPVVACGADDEIYKCLEKATHLSPQQKRLFNAYPEPLVEQAVRFVYHPTTVVKTSHLRLMRHFCANPDLYTDTLRDLDKPPEPRKCPKEAIADKFKHGRIYIGVNNLRFEFLRDKIGVGFLDLQPGGKNYSVDWRDSDFKHKFLELLEKLGVDPPE